MKAQVFSIDFVMASAILLLSLGIALQTIDLAQKNADVYASLNTNNVETIAANLTSRIPGFQNHTPYCFKTSDVSQNTCGGFSCNGSIFTATRLYKCGEAPCSLEVRACA